MVGCRATKPGAGCCGPGTFPGNAVEGYGLVLEIYDAVRHAVESGHRCATATIIRASGSVPRPVGTSMLVTEEGDITGSLSGGCVEGAVLTSALEVIAHGSSRYETYGYSDDDAFAVGLSCGGTLDVLISPVSPGTVPALDPQEPAAWLCRVDSQEPAPLLVREPAAYAGPAGLDAFLSHHAPELGSLLADRSPAAAADPSDITRAAAALLPWLLRGTTGLVTLPGCSGGEFFLESRLPAARMVLVGANAFSAALARLARTVGYSVTICDARPAFTSPGRFPEADEVVVQWPHTYLRGQLDSGLLDSRSVVCVLSHDAKFDLPVLSLVLRRDVAYVGAMGSRRTHAQRIQSLRAEGLQPEELARLYSPIGLDIGAVTPEETALSILSEIVASRSGVVNARPLAAGTGPIHAGGPARAGTTAR